MVLITGGSRGLGLELARAFAARGARLVLLARDQEAPRGDPSQGLDLKNPAAATPIGVGCKVCERPSCPQRAFPPIGRRIAVDENESRFVPYRVE